MRRPRPPAREGLSRGLARHVRDTPRNSGSGRPGLPGGRSARGAVTAAGKTQEAGAAMAAVTPDAKGTQGKPAWLSRGARVMHGQWQAQGATTAYRCPVKAGARTSPGPWPRTAGATAPVSGTAAVETVAVPACGATAPGQPETGNAPCMKNRPVNRAHTAATRASQLPPPAHAPGARGACAPADCERAG